MIQWEYKIKKFIWANDSPAELEFISKLGEDGWQLCAINTTDALYYFKRPLKQQDEQEKSKV
jgi:hypothetical protein